MFSAPGGMDAAELSAPTEELNVHLPVTDDMDLGSHLQCLLSPSPNRSGVEK